jgi:hypothetical protein
MRESIMALRGLIDRDGASHFFLYPRPEDVRPGVLSSWWPTDPWTGSPLHAGTGQGEYRYSVAADRRHYRLIGFLGTGRRITLRGGIPRDVTLAYDHRGEEGLNLIRQYVEDYAGAHSGVYPLPVDVAAEGAVGSDPVRRYWPSNPWNHNMMKQRGDHGSFTYQVAPDRLSYTLRLHRALKHDYVLTGAFVTNPWQEFVTGLEDQVLRRAGGTLAAYVDQWARHHNGSLPDTAVLAPGSRLAAAHPDWPLEPLTGAALHPGTAPGDYTYAPGTAGAFKLTVHLHSGDFKAGGSAPSASAPAHGSGSPES